MAASDILRGFGVELRQPHPRLQLGRCLREVGRHHPARAAPRSPEIDHDRNVVFAGVAIEIGRGQLGRLADEELPFAMAADRRVGKPGFRHRLMVLQCGHTMFKAGFTARPRVKSCCLDGFGGGVSQARESAPAEL